MNLFIQFNLKKKMTTTKQNTKNKPKTENKKAKKNTLGYRHKCVEYDPILVEISFKWHFDLKLHFYK